MKTLRAATAACLMLTPAGALAHPGEEPHGPGFAQRFTQQVSQTVTETVNSARQEITEAYGKITEFVLNKAKPEPPPAGGPTAPPKPMPQQDQEILDAARRVPNTAAGLQAITTHMNTQGQTFEGGQTAYRQIERGQRQLKNPVPEGRVPEYLIRAASVAQQAAAPGNTNDLSAVMFNANMDGAGRITGNGGAYTVTVPGSFVQDAIGGAAKAPPVIVPTAPSVTAPRVQPKVKPPPPPSGP